MAVEMLDLTGQPLRPATDETVRRVEFVGLPSPITDPAVQMLKRQGKLTGKRREKIYELESKRQMRGFCRYPGLVRWVGPEHGFSRRYEWTAQTGWIAWMTPADIDRLMQMHDANAQAFRVLDDILTG